MPNLMIIDHPLWIDTIQKILLPHGFNVIGRLCTFESAKNALVDQQPHLVLLNLDMIQTNEVGKISLIQTLAPEAKLIIIHADCSLCWLLQKVQVDGFVLKTALEAELAFAVKSVLDGHHYFSPKITSKLVKHILAPEAYRDQKILNQKMQVSDREKEVLQFILKEYTNQEIAEQLNISRRTVEVHKRNLLIKTNSKNIVGLVLYSLQHQLLEYKQA